jgi:hypothetical protein
MTKARGMLFSLQLNTRMPLFIYLFIFLISTYLLCFFLFFFRAYLIDTEDVTPPLALFDTYSFLYEGQNLGPPPVGCPYFAQLLTQADTGDIFKPNPPPHMTSHFATSTLISLPLATAHIHSHHRKES